jgi:hypothetical protein
LKRDGQQNLEIVPLGWRAACAFIARHHRHHKAPRGQKFAIGVIDESGTLRGVATCGRPVARSLDDGLTLEVNRTCTDGCPNANSMLYGACARIAAAMGYARILTDTQEGETGASLRAAGWQPRPLRGARANWHDSSGPALRAIRDPSGPGMVARRRWTKELSP